VNEEPVGIVNTKLVECVLLSGIGDGIDLKLTGAMDAACSPWAVPAYTFEIIDDGTPVGLASLRLGSPQRELRYAGHVGYSVRPERRGERIAGRAVRRLLPLARAHGISQVWFTCHPTNLASKAVLRGLGARMVDVVDIPPDYDAYARGEREKERYVLDLGDGTNCRSIRKTT
jgi:tagatose 1,6-diphosphate aldolase